MAPLDTASILAVDDSPGKLLALSATLAELNQNVVTASSGQEALRHMLRQDFAVVLLDINMPGMDGFETATLIRKRKSSEHTPIIFVTSFPDDTHAARGYSLGAVDYILAPVDPGILKTKVMVFVELYKKTAQISLQAVALERWALQLQRLARASVAINSALSPDQLLQVVVDLARDLLGAQQAGAIAAPDQKWSTPRTAVSLSPSLQEQGPRQVLPGPTALLTLLSTTRSPVRLERGRAAKELSEKLGSEWPERLGWLAAPLSGRDGRSMGMLYVLEKVEGNFTPEDESILTQLAQMSSIAIENAVNAEALEANRLKDEFLTTLSHELRTPLAAMLGWTQLLRTGRLDSLRAAHAVEVIERNVLAQTKLIDDMLDVSRIITGKLRLQLDRTNLSAIVEAAMEAMRPAAEGKTIHLTFDNRLGSGADRIVGDPDRLQQIIWNLISNAIKFTPVRGRVEVTLTREGGEFEISVADSGNGMAPEFLAHAFDRFRQADSSATRTQGGLGIGLAIARHLAELHGGSVSAESPGPGLGSTFRVRLPAQALGLEEAEEPPREAARLPEPTEGRLQSLAGVRILVVEDQQDNRDLIAEVLRAAGADVAEAASVHEALTALRVLRPHALVSDIAMPGEDGYSLVRRIRQWPAEEGGATAAIAVSAYAREEDRARALAAGFHEHLRKPFEPRALTTAVLRLVSAGAGMTSSPISPVEPPGSPTTPQT
jgi:signal transduction histidine kinase/two-component SAPR family response regulator